MAATDIQTLFAESVCFACFGDLTTAEMLKLALLRRELIAISPMAATDTQTLLASGKCYNCFGPLSTAQILELALLKAQLNALNPAIDTSPQALVTYGTCFVCPGASMFETMLLALLDQISQNNGGGSGSCVNLEGPDANPNGIVTPDFVGQDYANGGNVWRATNLTNAGWVEICAGSNPLAVEFDDVNLAAFTFDGGDATTSISFPDLVNMGGNGIIVSNTSTLVSFSAPVLTGAGNITMDGSAALTTVNYAGLQNVNFFSMSNNNLLTSLNLNGLLNITSDFLLVGSPSLAVFTLPLLQTTGNSFALNGTSVASLNLSSLTAPLPAGGFSLSSNPLLASFSMNGQPLSDGGNYDFSINALNQASVDLVLSAGVAGGMTSGSIDLGGGTNSAPSVAGLANKAALILAGVSVTTN